MDLSTVASSLASGAPAGGVAGSVDLSVLASVQQLQAVLAAELFGSLGVGTAIDAYA
jgi:hypothetical protein